MDPVAVAAYSLGAVFLAGEAAAHVEQYAVLFSGVAWIGPLFLVNAAACFTSILGLTHRLTRRLAALTGILISVIALAALIVSYARGLFGWQEAGFSPEIGAAVITEAGAVIAFAVALASPTRLIESMQ